VHRWAGWGFPWGTLAVNLVGCALLGALTGLAQSRLDLTLEARLFLVVGVLGSFTTFSTLGYETIELLRRAAYLAALANAAGSLLLGMAALVAGHLSVRWLAL
jgi:CrcB protein